MKKVVSAAVLIALAITLLACGSGKSGDVLVTVGNSKITEGDLNTLAKINPRLKQQISSDFGKKKILDNLVEQELFYQASSKEGIERDPLVKEKIDLYRRVIISQAFLDKKLQDEAKKHYDEHKGEFEKLQLSSIAVKFKKGDKDNTKRSEKEALDLANKIQSRLESGEDFAKVASEVSEDPMSAKRGGDLGMVSKDEARLVRRGFGPVLEKAFSMKEGEMSGPIKTEGFYQIIKVVKGPELQSYEDAEQAILFKIRNDVKNKSLEQLKKSYKITFAKSESEKKAEPAKVMDKAEGPKEEVGPEATIAQPNLEIKEEVKSKIIEKISSEKSEKKEAAKGEDKNQ